ncbi:MAG: 16S rRNA (guanine(527)-N(7))-methyltransferase RsmG [Clostridia bacterium]|nr:16S rRNA (guanine(527)-N(7))-methyltransferase RsmG [Clostridia bacterium]
MDINKFKELMKFYAEKIDIVFDDKQLNQFYDYMNLLIEWNKKINLTAITESEEIILKHFIDSLTINKYIEKNKSIVDVGTGAGFPGIPLKIYRPDIKVTLVDSLNKRINFLNNVISELELENIYTVHGRIEDFGRNSKYRENFDYVTARAVANLTVLSEYLIPISKVGGKCICMKGSNVEDELEDSSKAINILGGEICKIDKFELPNTNISRNIVIIDKIRSTPSKYPRKSGIPVKEPLK